MTQKTTSITLMRQRMHDRRRNWAIVSTLILIVAFLAYQLGFSQVALGLAAIGAIALYTMPYGYSGNPAREEPYLRWKALPTLQEYLEAHPECKTSSGPKCHHCSSRSLRNWGLADKHDGDRFVNCNACGHSLYRI